MNQNHPSPEDAGRPKGATADPVQSARIEQQLKRFRPRPAEYDIEAIVRSASAADEPIVLSERPEQNRNHRSYRWISTIAASWICGAIAGALVTVVLLSRSATLEPANDGIATQNQTRPDLASPATKDESDGDVEHNRNDESPKNVPRWSRSELLVAVMLEPYGRATAQYGGEWPPLRAGDSTSVRTTPGSWHLRHLTDATQREWEDSSDLDSDAGQEVLPSDPEPPITREQLLQELIGTSPEFVL